MRSFLISSAVLGLAANLSYGDEPAGQLSVRAEVATIKIAPQQSGSPLLELPAIDLTVFVSARCQDALRPESVSISVADTRLTLAGDELTSGEVLERTIRIPANQLAPVATGDFCIAGNSASEATLLHVPEALSAQLSLKCAGDAAPTMLYLTRTLGIALSCMPPVEI